MKKLKFEAAMSKCQCAPYLMAFESRQFCQSLPQFSASNSAIFRRRIRLSSIMSRSSGLSSFSSSKSCKQPLIASNNSALRTRIWTILHTPANGCQRAAACFLTIPRACNRIWYYHLESVESSSSIAFSSVVNKAESSSITSMRRFRSTSCIACTQSLCQRSPVSSCMSAARREYYAKVKR